MTAHHTQRPSVPGKEGAKNLPVKHTLLIQNKSRQMVKNSRAYHSAEIGSDHFPVLANLQLKLKKPRPAKAVPRRYDVEKLTGRNDLANDFEVML